MSLTRPINIGAEEGALLQFLIRLAGVRDVVEIGTLTGYSALWIARALPEGGRLITLEKEAAYAALARETFAHSDVEDKITLIEGDAQDSLASLGGSYDMASSYDMVFVDADKLSYARYLDWAEENVRKGGLIVLDNSLLFDNVYLDTPCESISRTAHEVMRQCNKRLSDKTRYSSILIPTDEGMTIAQKLF